MPVSRRVSLRRNSDGFVTVPNMRPEDVVPRRAFMEANADATVDI